MTWTIVDRSARALAVLGVLVAMGSCASRPKPHPATHASAAPSTMSLDATVPAVSSADRPPGGAIDQTVTLNGDLAFGLNSADLTAAAVAILHDLADALRAHPTAVASIDGYASIDAAGQEAQDLDLSIRRANAVKQWLVGDGVGADRITATGHGQADPLAPNDTPVHRAQNRRVSVLITNQPPK